MSNVIIEEIQNVANFVKNKKEETIDRFNTFWKLACLYDSLDEKIKAHTFSEHNPYLSELQGGEFIKGLITTQVILEALTEALTNLDETTEV